MTSLSRAWWALRRSGGIRGIEYVSKVCSVPEGRLRTQETGTIRVSLNMLGTKNGTIKKSKKTSYDREFSSLIPGK